MPYTMLDLGRQIEEQQDQPHHSAAAQQFIEHHHDLRSHSVSLLPGQTATPSSPPPAALAPSLSGRASGGVEASPTVGFPLEASLNAAYIFERGGGRWRRKSLLEAWSATASVRRPF
jgi:hypothetical protein